MADEETKLVPTQSDWKQHEGPNGPFYSRQRIDEGITVSAIVSGTLQNPTKVEGIIHAKDGSNFTIHIDPGTKVVAITHTAMQGEKPATMRYEINTEDVLGKLRVTGMNVSQEGMGNIDSFYWDQLGIPDPRGKGVDLAKLLQKIMNLDFGLPQRGKAHLFLLNS